MSLLWTSPLGPLLVLTVGAVLLMLRGRLLSERLRVSAPAWLAGLALIFWLLLRFQPERLTDFRAWQVLLGLNSTLGFQLDGWAWLAGVGIGLIAFIALVLPGWHWQPGFVDPRHWTLLATAAALVAILANTWISLLAAWVLLLFLVGLIAGKDDAGSTRAWSVGILSTMLLLAAPLFNGADTLLTPFDNVQLNAQAQLFLVLAALLPLGFYPFHNWLTSQTTFTPSRYLALHLLAGLAALHLLGRFDLPLLSSQAWVPFGIVALLGSALVAWTKRNQNHAWSYTLINRSAWAVLVLGLSRLPAPANAILPLITLALGGALWTIAQMDRQPRRWQWPFWLSFAVMIGLPLTPAFAPTLILSDLTGSAVGIVGWLLILLAQTLLIAALLRQRPSTSLTPDTQLGHNSRLISLGLYLAAILALWWGVFPTTLAQLTGLSDSGYFVSGFSYVISGGLLGWATILIPLALGILLHISESRLFGSQRDWRDSVARIVGLDWLYATLGRILHSFAVALGVFADLIDGAGQFGWVLLAILLVLILLGT